MKFPTYEDKDGTNLAEVGTDCISRQAAKNAICDYVCAPDVRCVSNHECRMKQLISELPPASSSEIPNSSDTISRKEAISAICNACGKIDCDKMDKCEKLQLPPAQPERIRGRWIETGKYFPNTHWQLVYEVICDKCNGIAYLRKSDKAYIGANICPNCGAEMEVTT